MKLANFNLAKILHALGYDGEYPDGYADDGELVGSHAWIKYPAPRLDDVAYWIREKHSLNIRISFWQIDEWFFDILNIETAEYYYELYEYHDTYDDALESATYKAIEIIKEKSEL